MNMDMELPPSVENSDDYDDLPVFESSVGLEVDRSGRKREANLPD